MPFVTRECIEKIRYGANIYDVVSPVVSLTQRGRDYWGLSPFKQEKTPSFKIDPEKGFFKCFSSDTAGDIFRFVQLTENLTFNEAVETLANRFNIPLEYEDGSSGPSEEQRSLYRELNDIHEYACDFYHRALMADNPIAEAIRQYWVEERKFSMESARNYKIGFAPPQSRDLNQILLKKNFSTQAIQECGLFFCKNPRVSPDHYMNRFQGRLMIPIRNAQKQVIAFTARKLSQTPEEDPSYQAKYVNSPETPIFHKSKIVFGLDHAREHVDEHKSFIMVEGQLDALRCWEAGLHTAIAPQGTSITENQLNLLRRYSSHLTVLLDGDSAGLKAAMRIVPLVTKAGLDTNFITLPEGSDPDSFICEHSSESFLAFLEKSKTSLIPFALGNLLSSSSPSAQEKSRVMARIFEFLSEIDSQITQYAYLDEAINQLKLDKGATLNDFKHFCIRKKRGRPAPPLEVKQKEPLITKQRLTTTEFDLLYLILQDERIANPIAEVIDIEWISTESTEGRILARILLQVQEEMWEGIQSIDLLLENEEERNAVYSILAETRPFDNILNAINETLKCIFSKYCDRRLKAIDKSILNMSDSDPSMTSLLTERRDIKKCRHQYPVIEDIDLDS